MELTQANRLLSLTTPLPYNELAIGRLSAHEGISQLFQFDLELLHHGVVGAREPNFIDPKKLVGQPMALEVLQGEGSTDVKRHFHGICISFAQGNRTARWTKYNAVLVPRVWMLTQVRQSRIFQQKNVKEILTTVLAGYDVKFELRENYKSRNYCVQYRESDWDFASRLMEEEGIFYFFEHSPNEHKLVIADTPQSHQPCPSKSTIEFAVDRSSVKEDWAGSILTWQVDDRVRTGKYTLWDHQFELPGKQLESTQISRFDIGGNKNLQIYDFPGGYAKRYDGVDPGGADRPSDIQNVFYDNVRTTKLRQQELDVLYKNYFGTSDCCSLQAGFRFDLTKHPHADHNGKYVVVAMRTEAIQSPGYVSDEKIEDPYSVTFVGISYGKQESPPFRPLRRTPKPIVHGSQTALVVGPAGEEIFTDKYGRVKVQFHWDRHGRMNDKSSCWLRVAQMWAGKKWGTMFIPRIGMEVLVDFLEGDPDQPIIVGCVYNSDNMPPYTLPDDKTRSTIKTNSSKGGSGFNEIRFEDKKGEEQIFIHAQKDMDVRVKHDKKEIVENEKHTIVKSNQFSQGGGNNDSKLSGNSTVEMGGSSSVKIGGDYDIKVGGKTAIDSGGEIHLKAGMKVIIEAGVQISLKAGGSFVDIGPGGVTISGPMIKLNSGGAAGAGAGAAVGSPTAPKEADKDDPGQSTKPPPPPAGGSAGAGAGAGTGAGTGGAGAGNSAGSGTGAGTAGGSSSGSPGGGGTAGALAGAAESGTPFVEPGAGETGGAGSGAGGAGSNAGGADSGTGGGDAGAGTYGMGHGGANEGGSLGDVPPGGQTGADAGGDTGVASPAGSQSGAGGGDAGAGYYGMGQGGAEEGGSQGEVPPGGESGAGAGGAAGAGETWENPDGTKVTKYPDGTQVDERPDGTTGTYNPDGTGTETDPDGTTYNYDENGNVTSQQNPDGSSVVYPEGTGGIGIKRPPPSSGASGGDTGRASGDTPPMSTKLGDEPWKDPQGRTVAPPPGEEFEDDDGW